MGDNKSAQQPDVNEQIKVRMEKLKNLQDAGKDPFQITKYDVTHHTDEIRAIYEAHEKELLGDRPAVNTEGLDEQQAREAVNADYNEAYAYYMKLKNNETSVRCLDAELYFIRKQIEEAKEEKK